MVPRAVPGRAVFLPNRDHHGALVSSRALEIAGVDAGTPDPPDGRIELVATGNLALEPYIGHTLGTIENGRQQASGINALALQDFLE